MDESAFTLITGGTQLTIHDDVAPHPAELMETEPIGRTGVVRPDGDSGRNSFEFTSAVR